MKSLLLVYLFLVTSLAFAQKNDAINMEELKINGKIAPGNSPAQVISAFGKPTSVGTYHSELDDEDWVKYNYDGSHMYFYDEKLIGFELTTGKFFLTSSDLRVNNKISSLARLYPASYAERGISNGTGYFTIGVLAGSDELQDIFINVMYDPSTNLITSIGTSSY